MPNDSRKLHLQITLWEEEYGIFQKILVINWLINSTSRSALQVAEATDVVKNAYLITYIWYVLENDTKDSLYKPT
jgi:hypothetical protein